MRFAVFQPAKSREAALLVASLLLMIYPALIACLNISYRLSSWPPYDPWAAAVIVEGWRASSGLPVYEPPGVGHATWMYGPAEPLVLGWAFKIFGPTKFIPQLLSVGGALYLVLLGWIILRPFLTLIPQFLAVLSFITLEFGVSYYCEGRPDYPAWALGFSGLLLMLYGRQNKRWGSFVAGAILITAGVCFKQTAAMLTIVPPIVALCIDRERILSSSFLLSLMPIAFVGGWFLRVYAFTPELYYYMVVVPKRYSIHLVLWLRIIGEFLAGAASLWFGLGWVLASTSGLSQFGSKWWQHRCWIAVTFIVTVLCGALTMAKEGGWYNLLIPSWFSLVTLSWLLLVPLLGFSPENGRRMPTGYQTLLSTVIIVFTFLFHRSSAITGANLLTAFRDNQTVNRFNREYTDVISKVQSLKGNIVSLEDPTITLFAKGKIDRSIYLEYDVIPWPSSLPQWMVAELSTADYIVHPTKLRPDPISSQDLEGFGFELSWSNDSYAIWKARGR
jgi:hypothetical protein